MDLTHPGAGTPLLDEWRAEVGDDAVVEAVARARRQIADGLIPALTKKDDLRNQLYRPA